MQKFIITMFVILASAQVAYAIPVMPEKTGQPATTQPTPGEQAVADVIPDTSKIRGWTGRLVDTLERYRLRELEYFTALHAKSQEVLGVTTIKEVKTFFAPAPAPAVPGTATTEDSKEEKPDRTMEYVTLGYAMAGKAFFARKALYFIVIILMALFFIRFIFKRFV